MPLISTRIIADHWMLVTIVYVMCLHQLDPSKVAEVRMVICHGWSCSALYCACPSIAYLQAAAVVQAYLPAHHGQQHVLKLTCDLQAAGHE